MFPAGFESTAVIAIWKKKKNFFFHIVQLSLGNNHTAIFWPKSGFRLQQAFLLWLEDGFHSTPGLYLKDTPAPWGLPRWR